MHHDDDPVLLGTNHTNTNSNNEPTSSYGHRRRKPKATMADFGMDDDDDPEAGTATTFLHDSIISELDACQQAAPRKKSFKKSRMNHGRKQQQPKVHLAAARRLQNNLPVETPPKTKRSNDESCSSIISSIPSVSTLRDDADDSPPIPRKKQAKTVAVAKQPVAKPTAEETNKSAAAQAMCDASASDTDADELEHEKQATKDEWIDSFETAQDDDDDDKVIDVDPPKLRLTRAKKKAPITSVLEQHTQPPERSRTSLFPPPNDKPRSETANERKSRLRRPVGGFFKGKKVNPPKEDIGAWRVQPEADERPKVQPKSRGVPPSHNKPNTRQSSQSECAPKTRQSTLPQLTLTRANRRSTRASSNKRTSDSVDLCGDVDDDSPATKRRRGRSKNKKVDEIIEIDDDDDDEEEVGEIDADDKYLSMLQEPSLPPETDETITVPVARISMGEDTIFRHQCSIATVDATRFKLQYTTSEGVTQTHRISADDVRLFQYYSEPDHDRTHFLIFQAVATRGNKLPLGGVSIVLEIRVPAATRLLERLNTEILSLYAVTGNQLRSEDESLMEAVQYLHQDDADGGAERDKLVVTTDDTKPKRTRRRDATRKPRKEPYTERDENDLLLDYPFGGGMWEAARGLGPLECVLDTASSSTESTPEDTTVHVVLRVADYDCLVPGEYLNDNLIDFFCQWIWSNADKTNVHVFTSHFFSTLEKEGPEGVTSWTRRRDINVFSKKFIFIPVNKFKHWSLCVVVNPGFAKEGEVAASEYKRTPDPAMLQNSVPCILFFDSLQLHSAQSVANQVRKWLTHEWKRLQNPRETFTFIERTLPVVTPKIPRQRNGWDCGVFVCRYAYAMFLLRDATFTYASSGMTPGVTRSATAFRALITNSTAFDFSLNDIADIRDQLATLIQRLHELYVPWRKVQLEKDKTERRKAKLAQKEKTGSEDAEEGEKPAAKAIASAADTETKSAVANGDTEAAAIDVPESQDSVEEEETKAAEEAKAADETTEDAAVSALTIVDELFDSTQSSDTVVEVVPPQEDVAIAPAESSIVFDDDQEPSAPAATADLSQTLDAMHLKENRAVQDADINAWIKPKPSPVQYESI